MSENLILTTVGLAKLAVATPETPLQISHLAVGDGNGDYPALDPGMTELVHEVWRGPASDPIREADAPNVLKFETVIPAEDGGFFIREMGIFDSGGDLIAIAKCAVVEKPGALSGSAVTLTVSMRLTLSNASQTTVVVTEQAYIDHQGLSGREVANAHPMAAITGMTGVFRMYPGSVPVLLDGSLPGVVCVTAYSSLDAVALPDTSTLSSQVELTVYLSQESEGVAMVMPGAGLDAMYDVPTDMKWDSYIGVALGTPGEWVRLRSHYTPSGARGWYVIAASGRLGFPTETQRGKPLVATAADVADGVDDGKMVTPAGLKTVADTKANTATSITAGNGLSGGGTLAASRTIALGTPSTLSGSTANSVTENSHTHAISAATDALAGVVELATTAEASTGTDTTRAVTPAGLKAVADTKANTATSITAGNGLSGGGTLAASRTIALGTPSTLSGSTSNAVTATSHTHELAAATTSLAGVIEIATATEVRSGSDGARAVTPSGLVSAFTGSGILSAANSGYQKLPSGIIIQWGRNSVNSDSSKTFNFPITFPGNTFIVGATLGSALDGLHSYSIGIEPNPSSPLSSARVTVTSTGSVMSTGFSWFAIGN